MAKKRTCTRCGIKLTGRRDALTCSDRCRQAVSRMRARSIGEPIKKQPEELEFKLPESVEALAPKDALVVTKKRFWFANYFKGLIIILALGCVLGGQTVSALPIVQGYMTRESDLKPGMMVALSRDTDSQTRYVEKINQDNSSRLAGVVVNRDDALLAVADAASMVYVAESGQLPTLVSDLNGTPKKGDRLTISPLMGIMMRASDPAGGTFGVVLEDFAAGQSQTVTVKDSSGQPVSAKVAKLNANIDVRQVAGAGTTDSRGWLGNFGHSLTGKEVSPPRVLAGIIVFASMLSVEGVIVHGLVSGSLKAIGRNPLARESVQWEFFRGVAVATAILVVSLSVISLIIWV